MHAPIVIVNPSDRGNHQSRWGHDTPRFVLSFGAYGSTHLMVWGHLEDALEEAADWLADNAPGHIMLHGHGGDTRDPQLDELMAETCEELGLAWPIPDDCDDMQPYWDAEQTAYADLTYTERGYLTSYEWCITLDEHATRADVKAFIAELAVRHYGDGPVCDITRKESL